MAIRGLDLCSEDVLLLRNNWAWSVKHHPPASGNGNPISRHGKAASAGTRSAALTPLPKTTMRSRTFLVIKGLTSFQARDLHRDTAGSVWASLC